MAMADEIVVYLFKAEQSLQRAKSEYVNRRYDSCANRCYYACVQAAIAALIWAGMRSSGERWDHEFVQAQFTGRLINQRKLYPSELRNALERLFTLRQTADYKPEFVSEVQANRALRRSREFVDAIRQEEGGRP